MTTEENSTPGEFTPEQIAAEMPKKAPMNPHVKMAILGVLFGIFVLGVYFIGGTMACSNGGGTTVGFPFPTCLNPIDVGVCTINGEQYVTPMLNDSNLTFALG